MRNLLRIAVLAVVLAACGDSTGTNDGQPGVLDRMFLYNPQINFDVGDSYVFANYWKAYDGVGTEMPVDSIGLRYSLGDSLAPAGVVGGGAITLKVPFIGFLYVFAPTSRAPLERLGKHYITVNDTTAF